MRFPRTLLQLFFLEFILYVGITGLVTGSSLNCESYCPLGVVATVVPLVRDGNLYCSMTELNLAILLGLVLLTLVVGRAFCSWACPFGAVSEWLGELGKRLGIARELPEGRPGKVLLALKFVVLALIVVFSTLAGDLVFRSYCPYFTLFSFHGHEVRVISYFVLANVLLAGLFFPLSWCRVLCPLHAFLGMVGKFPGLRLHRAEASCLGCSLCNEACPERIPVAERLTVTDMACSRCMSCMDACPEGSLVFGPMPARPVTPWLVPVLVLGLLVGSTRLAGWIRIPTLEQSFPAPAGAPLRRAQFVVDGLRCRGTAGALARLVAEGGGVASLAAYASGRELVVDYLPEEVPVEELIFRFDRDVEINGQTLHPFRCLRYRDGPGEWVVLQAEPHAGEVSVKDLE